MIFFVFSLAKESVGLTIVQAANPAASSEPNQTTTVMTTTAIVSKFNVSITRQRDLHISPSVKIEGNKTHRLFKTEEGDVLPVNNNSDIMDVLNETHRLASFAPNTEFYRIGTLIAKVDGNGVVPVDTDRVFRFDAGDKKLAKKELTPEERLLQALEGDTLTMAEIIDATGFDNALVRSLLRKLMDEGNVVAAKQGSGSKAKNAYSINK